MKSCSVSQTINRQLIRSYEGHIVNLEKSNIKLVERSTRFYTSQKEMKLFFSNFCRCFSNKLSVDKYIVYAFLGILMIIIYPHTLIL